MTARRTMLAAGLALAMSGVGVGVTSHAANAATQTIVIKSNKTLSLFAPAVVRAHTGTIRMVFDNTSAGTLHTLDAQHQSTGTVAPGGSRSITFTVTKPSVIRYLCEFHATIGMDGLLVVS